jgi:UDP-GlcNAc:undecaprenyl-phosphate/decaprenyl-phosphate GlcNAc-1-phosphate transferase
VVVVAIVISGAVAWAMGRLALWVGPPLGIVDRPDDPDLKVHERAAVPMGGVAIFVALAVGSAAAGGFDPLVIPMAALVVALGVVDDRASLSPAVRLSAETGIAAMTIAAGLTPLRIDDPFEAVVGLGVIVVAINAVNLFDGLDALAGSASFVAFVGLGALAALRGLDFTFPLLIAGAIAGFLALNRPPARLFLGDNGSYLLGFLLAVAVLRMSPGGVDVGLAIAGLALGVFLLDFSVTILRRRISGRPLFTGDRTHLYDLLHDRGWAVGAIAVLAAATETLFVVTGLVIELFWVSWWTVIPVLLLCLAVVVVLAWRSPSGLSGAAP